MENKLDNCYLGLAHVKMLEAQKSLAEADKYLALAARNVISGFGLRVVLDKIQKRLMNEIHRVVSIMKDPNYSE